MALNRTKARITPAHPPADALSQAKAMDRNAAINTSLGKMFAETVSIRCAGSARPPNQ